MSERTYDVVGDLRDPNINNNNYSPAPIAPAGYMVSA